MNIHPFQQYRQYLHWMQHRYVPKLPPLSSYQQQLVNRYFSERATNFKIQCGFWPRWDPKGRGR